MLYILMKTKQNKDYECFADFPSLGSYIKPFDFLPPHSLVGFKTLVSKVEVFEARNLKAGQVVKQVSPAGSPPAGISSPRWTVCEPQMVH